MTKIYSGFRKAPTYRGATPGEVFMSAMEMAFGPAHRDMPFRYEKRKEEPALTGSDLDPVKDADTAELELEDGPGGLAFESGEPMKLEQ